MNPATRDRSADEVCHVCGFICIYLQLLHFAHEAHILHVKQMITLGIVHSHSYGEAVFAHPGRTLCTYYLQAKITFQLDFA